MEEVKEYVRVLVLYLLNVPCVRDSSLARGAMCRAFVTAGSLLLCGAIAARSKSQPLVFVFLRVDSAQNVAVLRPMIAPDIGVRLDLPAGQAGSGLSKLELGTVLQCEASAREHDAIVEGEVAKVSEMVLDCLPAARRPNGQGEAGGERTFVVKTLDFRPARGRGGPRR